MAITKFSGSKVIAGPSVLPLLKKLGIQETPDGSEQDTGFDLPARAVVLDVWVETDEAEVTGSTPTLRVGLLSSEVGGDLDGFLDDVDVSAAGLQRGSLDSAGQTRGVFLTEDEDGAGALVPAVHLSDSVTAKSVVYQAASGDWAEFKGAIWIMYYDLAKR